MIKIFKNYKKSFLVIGIVLFMLTVIMVKNIFFPSYVQAHDNLRIDFHVASPLFKILNIKPGDEETRKIDITNKNKEKVLIYTKGVRKNNNTFDLRLDEVLFITIKNNDSIVYGEGSLTGIKTLQNFFYESGKGILLGTIKSRENKKYNISVKFTDSAGNEYQGKSVVFDLIFGVRDYRFPKDRHECYKNKWRSFNELNFRNQSDCYRFTDD
jgi:hypothetical protein